MQDHGEAVVGVALWAVSGTIRVTAVLSPQGGYHR